MTHENANVDPQQANGVPRAQGRDLRGSVEAMIGEWPVRIDAQMKRAPLTTLGFALAIGLGAGVVLSSRIMRAALASAASYAMIEVARTVLQRAVGQPAKPAA